MLDLSSRSVSGFSGVRSDLQAVNSILQDCALAPSNKSYLFFYTLLGTGSNNLQNLLIFHLQPDHFNHFDLYYMNNGFFVPTFKGFIDAFTSGKTVQINHGQRLFKVFMKLA